MSYGPVVFIDMPAILEGWNFSDVNTIVRVFRLLACYLHLWIIKGMVVRKTGVFVHVGNQLVVGFFVRFLD